MLLFVSLRLTTYKKVKKMKKVPHARTAKMKVNLRNTL